MQGPLREFAPTDDDLHAASIRWRGEDLYLAKDPKHPTNMACGWRINYVTG